MALTDPREGNGLLLRYSSTDAPPARKMPEDAPSCSRPAETSGAQLSVSRWTVSELDAVQHRHELPFRDDNSARPIWVHLDTAQMGVGGVGAGTAKVWATASQFMIDP